MSLKPIIAGNFVQVPSGGGGSSTPGLPVWTYTSGAMASGKMKTSDANPSVTASIDFSDTAKNGLSTWDSTLQLFFNSSSTIRCGIVFTNSSGISSTFRVTSRADDTGFTTLGVAPLTTSSTPWSGDYQISFFLVPGDTLVDDTGWAANASAGDKTAVVADYTPGLDGSMVAALDVLVTGAGTALAADEAQIALLTKKLQAIESGLSNNLRPNA